MALDSFIGGSFSPTRFQTGRSDPNYQAPDALTPGKHPWLQDFERSQYLEDNPRQAFQAFSPQFGTGTKRQGILGGFDTILDQYLGNLGRNVMEGDRAPVGGFGDFLAGTRGYDQPFDFDKFFHDMYPGAIERADAMHQPSIRYLFT